MIDNLNAHEQMDNVNGNFYLFVDAEYNKTFRSLGSNVDYWMIDLLDIELDCCKNCQYIVVVGPMVNFLRTVYCYGLHIEVLVSSCLEEIKYVLFIYNFYHNLCLACDLRTFDDRVVLAMGFFAPILD